MEFIKAKTLLTKVKNGDMWYGMDYNMNLYRGCSHGCIYCDSRSNCYHIDNFDVVRGKVNALAILESELARKRQKGVIGIGAMSDTYNPQEFKYELTRGALKLIEKYGFGVSVDTKSDLVLRDMDLLKKIGEKNDVIVKLTITTPNDDLSRIIEPRVCPSSQRFEAVKALNENGIFAGVMMNPTLPFITDKPEDIRQMVYLAHKNGAKFIHTFLGMTLRENQKDYYYQQLDKHFPNLKDRYITVYGSKYVCNVQNYNYLFSIFKNECNKYGILYDMRAIVKAYKKHNKIYEQTSFF
ncbi:MAG: radical SAM protein [Eubacterium sp.]|nr:radical SAM protein [Eubacterium sp.]MDE6156108.1 radical SAM protein [Eubacterium sp.]